MLQEVRHTRWGQTQRWAAPSCSVAPMAPPGKGEQPPTSQLAQDPREDPHIPSLQQGKGWLPTSSWTHWANNRAFPVCGKPHTGVCDQHMCAISVCVCSTSKGRQSPQPVWGQLKRLLQSTQALSHAYCPCYVFIPRRYFMPPSHSHGAVVAVVCGSLGCRGARWEEGGMADTSFSDCRPPPRLRLWNKTLAGLFRKMISSMYELSQRTQFLSLWCLF